VALCCLVFPLNQIAAATKKTEPTILVLGDSLSGAYGINTNEGWTALLQQQITRSGYQYKVVNASVSGDTTRTGLTRLGPALKQHKPEIVIVALGGNDGLRGLAFSEIETSLGKIIEKIHFKNARVLLVAERLPPNYGPAYNKQFAAIYHRLAQHYNIPLVPKLLANVAEHRELMQQDGIHPTAKAQPRVMQNVWRHLEPMLKKPV